mgnify:CR=1 FL=1
MIDILYEHPAVAEAAVVGVPVGVQCRHPAGPAISPLLKVMNLVSVLIAPAVVLLSVPEDANHALRIGIAVVAAGIAFGAVILSRLRAARVDREQMAEEPQAVRAS